MKPFRHLVAFFGILLILPLILPAVGLGAALAPVPLQVQLSGPPPSGVAAQAGDPQRIQFQPGSTSATVQGTVAPNSTNQYVLQASAGQTLTVQVTTSQGQVIVTISGADGTLLVTDYVGNSTFSGVVPTTQDYTISVQAAGQVSARYALGISIPAVSSSPTPPAGALRIQFAPGATSATVQGNLPANGSQKYVIHVAAGQLMQVEVTPQQNMQMSVQGVDGTVLKSSSGIAFFRGDVPTTQDYIVTLTDVGTATAYTLTVTIPVRISFAVGATSATVQGNLPVNSIGHYVIQAQAGQTMTIQTTTSQGQIVVIVYGADGTVLQSDHAGATGFIGTLPSTQDYLIDIRSVGQVTAVFSMTVTIPPLGSTTPPSGAQRIQFAPGATSAAVQGNLPANGSQQYVIHVAAGQFLQVDTISQQNIQMSVQGVDGTVLKSSAGIASFRGDVPTTQDYIITLTSSAATPYTLTVTVPVRISFATGATSATVQGSLPTSSTGHYVIRAEAGQTMTIQTTASQGQVIVIVYGADGAVLQSAMAESGSFSGTLPSTQNYLIDVESGPNSAARFSMTVTIPPLGSSTTPPAGARRILFAAGATSATTQGNLPANGSQQYYIRVQAGQILTVDVTSPEPVHVSVRGANGAVLQGSNGNAFFRGVVPSTQDYIVTLTAGDEATAYSMTVTVPERISFAPGATSATVQGDLAPNTIGHYVIQAQAGQTMTIQTSTTHGQVVLVVYGADGTVLQSDHAGASSFSGTLPSTQNYFIELVSVGQVAAQYSMSVTIPPRY